MAEIRLSLLSRQCFESRIPDANTLRTEIHAWQAVRYADRASLHWSSCLKDACRKLYRLYPVPAA